ncbi:MAG TPA: c-type cytochrome biogenesis protein CcsB [Actinomycetes bacterium]|nr:c-type cytochrome biogenesis protein CcsB [Actinomycetes bacterium]
MSPAELASTSDTLAWLAVLSYVVAATLFGLEFAYGTRWFGVAGLTVTVAGLAANIGAAVTRGLAVDRVPWGNMYEFSIIVGIITVAGYLVWLRRRPEIRPLGVFVLLPAVLAMALGGLVFPVPAGPLVPALNSRWIVIHVAAAITGSSVLCLAAVFSILYLVKERMERRQRPPAPPLVAGAAKTADRVEVDQAVARHARVWDRLPSADTLDHLAYRTTAFGFPIWTFAIIAGAIWAQAAWGRYWGWDPKETWSFISWTVFAAYLHARATGLTAGEVAADVACGTGALARELEALAPGAVVVGLDFSQEMLKRAGRGRFAAGDALQLPLADASVDVVTIAFGLRNLPEPGQGLLEFRRVLRPGGRLVVCEFSTPVVPVLREVYGRYLTRLMPVAARRLTSDPEAYQYLARSIGAWPDQPALARWLQEAGFGEVAWRNLTGGIVALHRGVARP